MNLEKELNRLRLLWKDKNLTERRLDKDFSDELKSAENYVGKEFGKVLKKVDLKGYKILSHDVHYDANPAHEFFYIFIDKIKTPNNKILSGQKEISCELIAERLGVGNLMGKEYQKKDIIDFMEKNRVHYITQSDKK